MTPAGTDSIVALTADGTATVRAVAVGVHRIALVVGEVVSVDVIDVAVVVVVLTVSWNLAGVALHVVDEVRVVVVDTGVDDRDHETLITDAVVPCGWRID